MKLIISISLIAFGCTIFAQDTTKTPWIFVTDQPRQSSDTAYWIYGKVLPTSDTTGIQYRKSVTGIIQRRELYYKKEK